MSDKHPAMPRSHAKVMWTSMQCRFLRTLPPEVMCQGSQALWASTKAIERTLVVPDVFQKELQSITGYWILDLVSWSDWLSARPSGRLPHDREEGSVIEHEAASVRRPQLPLAHAALRLKVLAWGTDPRNREKKNIWKTSLTLFTGKALHQLSNMIITEIICKLCPNLAVRHQLFPITRLESTPMLEEFSN